MPQRREQLPALSDKEMSSQKRKTLAGLYAAPWLHVLLQKFFRTENPNEKPLDPTLAKLYFQAQERPTNPRPAHPEFFTELKKHGFETEKTVKHWIYTPRSLRSYLTPTGPIVPLHIAALGRALDRIVDHISYLENKQLVKPPTSDTNYFKALESMDMQEGPAILRDTYITVLQIASLFAYHTKSSDEFIAIMERNLQPHHNTELARGFSPAELLSNTINGFWGAFLNALWEPNGIFDEQGQVSVQFISAVHSLIKYYPDKYHGGCPNRFSYDGQTMSAVDESFHIFLDQYKRALQELKPYEGQMKREQRIKTIMNKLKL